MNLSLEETEFDQSIDYLIHKYQSPEELSDYTCGKDEELGCQQTVNCYKSQKFSQTPNILLVQLKIYDSFRNKLDNLNISVDEQLNICGETIYLCGIIYHKGNSLTCGHYYAEIQYNGIWYLTNDTHIKPIIKTTLTGHLKKPYILLYRKLLPEIHFTIKKSTTSKMQEQAIQEIEFQKKKILNLKNKPLDSTTSKNSKTIQNDVNTNTFAKSPGKQKNEKPLTLLQRNKHPVLIYQ